MKHPRWILAVLFAGGITATVAAVQMQKGGSDDFGPYAPAADWYKPVRAGYFERGASVFAESSDRIFFTSDNEFPIPKRGGGPGAPAAPAGAHVPRLMILDANGNVVDEWKQWEYLFNCPHEVQISPYDPEKSVWVVDRDNSQVFKFSHDGKKLLMTLGEKGVIASDDTHFGRPSNISFAPDGSGDFYISDGYANTRVIKFDKNGKRLLTWGTPGHGPGQFETVVHDVVVDGQGRVYVADRGQNRIQVFDPNGKYIEEWDDIRTPSNLYITKDGFLWVASQQGNRLLKYDLKGHLMTYWGMQGVFAGAFDDPHSMSVDPAGNLYVAIYSNRKVGIERFEPKPGAARSRLVTLGYRSLSAGTSPTAMTTH